ncbi:hypothetical protein SSYM_0765, partial [Serratia symbiotica str. Tucson]
QGLLCWILFAG